MSEQKANSRAIRVVRILFIRKTGEYQAKLIAFITDDTEPPALTEEYLLSQPRIAALGIERVISAKENTGINSIVSRWFARTSVEAEKMEAAIAETLTGIETFIGSTWAFHDAPSIKMHDRDRTTSETTV